MNDVPLVNVNDINSINTSIIAIKKQLMQLNEAVGLIDTPNVNIDLTPFVKKTDVVDVVQSGNLNPVTSNAVATALSTKLDYVYDEVDTGIKWVNGKTIYRKVFNLSATLSNVSTSLLQNMNIDNLLKNDLQVWHTNQMYWVSNGILYNTVTKKISFSSTYQSVYVQFYIIEYTKTTDSATRNIEDTRKSNDEEPKEEPKEEEKK